MTFEDYFSPINILKYTDVNTIGAHLQVSSYVKEGSFPDWENCKIALIGVEEDRNSLNNQGCAQAPDAIRQFLYQLYPGNYSMQIADLGNIKRGHASEDTYFAVAHIVSELIKKKVIPIIIGGGQDITFANYKAYELLNQTINLVAIDSHLDLGEADTGLDSRSYLSKIILRQPNYLFNYSNIGYQTYFSNPNTTDLMSKLFFDVCRLGEARMKIEDTEPVIRNADMISFDISSVKQTDAPGNANAGPNGFYGEEACQLMRYAGMSDKITSLGLYEYNPQYDIRNQTAHLIAQMIWCFIDGYYNRKGDAPLLDTSGFTKYHVSLKDHKHEIVFYKSNKTDRWWMDIPYPQDKRLKYERHHLVPCTYSDYLTACNEEMPDRWWQTFQKLC